MYFKFIFKTEDLLVPLKGKLQYSITLYFNRKASKFLYTLHYFRNLMSWLLEIKKNVWEEVITSSFLQYFFELNGEPSKNYKLIVIPFFPPCLCIISTSIYFDQENFVKYNLKDSRCRHVCNLLFQPFIVRYRQPKTYIYCSRSPYCFTFYEEEILTKVHIFSKMYFKTNCQNPALSSSGITLISQIRKATVFNY